MRGKKEQNSEQSSSGPVLHNESTDYLYFYSYGSNLHLPISSYESLRNSQRFGLYIPYSCQAASSRKDISITRYMVEVADGELH